MHQKLSLKDFAHAIGLSTTQVSNAISGNGRVSPATRELVQQKMHELHYIPNSNAKRLGSGHSYLVGFSILGFETTSDPYVMHLIRSVMKPLAEHGYDLTLTIADNEAQLISTLRKHSSSRSHDAAIVLGCRDLIREYAHEIAAPHHPCVCIDRDAVDGIAHVGFVVEALAEGMQQVVDQLVALGHVNIGFIDHAETDELVHHFQTALELHGLQLRRDLFITGGVNADDGAMAFRRLMATANPPTAIMARTDVLAIGAVLEAERLGIRVPGDVSVIGHDDLPLLMPRQAELASVHLDMEAIGKAAVDLVFELLQNPGTIAAPRVVKPQLIVRTSIGPNPRIQRS